MPTIRIALLGILSAHSAIADEITDLNARLSTLEAEVAALPAQPATNSGDTAWLLTSTALVLLMTLPGLALFYGGMAQVKNVLSTVFQTLSIACMVSILWFMMSYSLSFLPGSPVIGGAERFWLIGTQNVSDQMSPNRIGVSTINSLAPTIPETVTFEVINRPSQLTRTSQHRFSWCTR